MAERVRERFVHILYELTVAVGTTLDLDHEIAAFMEWLKRFLSPRVSVLFLTDENRQHMRAVATHPEHIRLETLMPLGVDPWKWLREQGVAVDVQGHLFQYAVPISTEGQMLGMLCLVSSASAEDIEDERTVVETAAGYLAPVLRNIWRYRTLEAQVEERTAALAQREAMFRALAEQAIVGIYLLTEDHFLYVNQALADMCGYKVEEVVNTQSPLDFVHPDDRALVREMMRKRFRGEMDAAHYRFRVLHRNGHTLHLEVYGRRIEYEGRAALMGVVIDITDRVYMEEAYHALVEHSLQGLVIVQDNRVVFANPAFLRGIGWTREAVTGCEVDRLMRIVHPDDREALRCTLEAALAEEDPPRPMTVTFRYTRSDGQMRWGQALGSRLTYRGRPAVQITFLDITRQVKSQQALERYATFLEARNRIIHEVTHATSVDALLTTALDLLMETLQVTTGAIWVTDDPFRLPSTYRAVRGAPSEYQPILAAMIRELRQHPQILERTLLISDVSDADQIPHPAIGRAMEEMGLAAAVIVPLYARDHRVGGLVVASSGPRAWTREEVALIEGIASEIGIAVERLRLIADLEKALRAKDEMIQDVSHELRTPLTMILGYVELLQEGAMGHLNEEQSKALSIVHRNAERLRFMIERLLLLRSLERETLDRAQFDVREWLDEVFLRWLPQFQEKGMSLSLHVAPDVVTMQADRRLLDEVMDNLLHNALKFSPNGGTVSIRAWCEDEEICIAVSDQGIGIPPDQLDRIFERFYQVSQGLSRRFDGMGIGLALCKEIVELHGGRIWAESEGEGKGSTFYIALPV